MNESQHFDYFLVSRSDTARLPALPFSVVFFRPPGTSSSPTFTTPVHPPFHYHILIVATTLPL